MEDGDNEASKGGGKGVLRLIGNTERHECQRIYIRDVGH